MVKKPTRWTHRCIFIQTDVDIQELPDTRQSELTINETVSVFTSCCSASHGSTRLSLTCPHCSSNCDYVYGTNLAKRSHIVLLIKFSGLAATSGVWAEGQECRNKRQKEGRGWSLFFEIQKFKEAVKKKLPSFKYITQRSSFPPERFLVK